MAASARGPTLGFVFGFGFGFIMMEQSWGPSNKVIRLVTLL
jgi:hypothetical protein